MNGAAACDPTHDQAAARPSGPLLDVSLTGSLLYIFGPEQALQDNQLATCTLSCHLPAL